MITRKQAHALDGTIILGAFALGGFAVGIALTAAYIIGITVVYGSEKPIVEPK